MALHWEHEVLTTGPPGKSFLCLCFVDSGPSELNGLKENGILTPRIWGRGMKLLSFLTLPR